MEPVSSYPLTFSVDYPDRELSRISTFFRIFAAIPILILLSALTGGSFSYSANDFGSNDATNLAISGAGILTGPVVLMLLFQQKYPAWWADWNREVMRFSSRVSVYLSLMDDRYPSTDDQQSVRLDFAQPDGRQLSRGLPLIKWFLAIPHYFALLVLGLGAFGAVVLAWFAILFTGRYPRSLFTFVEGVMRYANRVMAYAVVLITDEYPPFSLEP